MAQFKKNAKVTWKWLGKTIAGTIEEVFLDSVTKTIKGKKITRHGSKEKPAYLVKSDAGNLALKLQTELQTSSKPTKQASKLTPQIFK